MCHFYLTRSRVSVWVIVRGLGYRLGVRVRVRVKFRGAMCFARGSALLG